MVKGAMEHPEMIRTIDNPMGKSVKFPHGEGYAKLGALDSALKQRGRDVEQATLSYLAKRKADRGKRIDMGQEPEDEPPESLDFLEN